MKLASALLAVLAEGDVIARVLDSTHFNRRWAARLLGASYKTLLTKIRDFEAEPE